MEGQVPDSDPAEAVDGFVLVSGETFVMGSPEKETWRGGDEWQHTVTVGTILQKICVLIAYFSWGGNTRGIAEEIAGQTGADLFEITCVEPYSDSGCGYRRRACGQLFRGCIHAFGCQCMAGNKSCG